jgi:hypothetical protein
LLLGLESFHAPPVERRRLLPNVFQKGYDIVSTGNVMTFLVQKMS